MRRRGAPRAAAAAQPEAGQPGLVIRGYGASAEVEDAAGGRRHCSLRSKLGPLVSGDRVRWKATEEYQGVVVALSPRRNVLARADDRGRLRPVAANVTQLVIMIAPRLTGAGPQWDGDLIDHYLVAATLQEMQPLVLFNKSDVLDACAAESARALRDIYGALGYAAFNVSIKHRLGTPEIEAALRAHTSVVVGPSGSGKSSLVQALLPAEDVRVGEVTHSGQGRHTTSAATLYHLCTGGDLIDSPGVREFHLGHVSAQELARGFIEIQRHAPGCRFRDCRHLSEPGCAVALAASSGEVHPLRYASYKRILQKLTTEI